MNRVRKNDDNEDFGRQNRIMNNFENIQEQNEVNFIVLKNIYQ